MTAEPPSDNYIIDFNVDHTAVETMNQIRGKDHSKRFNLSAERLTLIAPSVSSMKRTIVEELVAEI